MTAFSAIIDELETAVQSRSDGRRVEILRQVTDLFLGGAAQFNDGQVELFDGVLAQLTQRVESNVLAELSAKLSPVANAPNGVIQSLARHDAIAVAGPVLSNSPRLTDSDLIEIASTKGQGHLGAISERSRLAEAVTDVLVERGDGEVLNKLTRNEGAAFSADGFSTLAKRAEDDGRLAENLGMRLDVPPQLLQELIAKAAEDVQRRLLDNAPPASQFIIRDALAHVASKVMRQAAAPRDFSRAEAVIEKMQAARKLTETAIQDFANAGRHEEVIVALARLCGAPTELVAQLMQNARHDGLLVACKAAELHWAAFSCILKSRAVQPPSAQELEQARVDFLKLSVATARRMFRFWLVRGTAKTEVGAAGARARPPNPRSPSR
jgi:uncharacterized protein (DUF2336 family)